MPKLWDHTIAAHRRTVRDAIVHSTVSLVAEHGLRSVTMSQIAEAAGVGRATLYKYFADVEQILVAWHARQINDHLEHLAEVRDEAGSAGERAHAVLQAYAVIRHTARRHADADVAAFLHRDEHLAAARRRLHTMVREVLAEGARSGDIRQDIAADELTSYCLHALDAAGSLPSKAAVRRLVTVTLAGLRPPPTPDRSLA